MQSFLCLRLHDTIGRSISKGEFLMKTKIVALLVAAVVASPRCFAQDADVDGDDTLAPQRQDAPDDSNNPGDADDDDDNELTPEQKEEDAEQFKEFNTAANEAAEDGDWQRAIDLWQQAIPYDHTPYAGCQGALQQVYIRVARHVIDMIQRGDLDQDGSVSWFKARVTNIWGNTPCNTP